MGSVFYDADGHVDPTKGWACDSGKCFACGDPKPSGIWDGQERVFVCSKCAVSVLPALIADAITFSGNRSILPHQALEFDIKKIVANLYRASAIASASAIDRKREGSNGW